MAGTSVPPPRGAEQIKRLLALPEVANRLYATKRG